MKCVVIETCWPNADTIWKYGDIVDVNPKEYALFEKYLKKMGSARPVRKVVEVKDDGVKDE